MAVAITRLELSARDLRREAGRCADGPAARRMLALALVLEGRSRAEAARCAGMDRQTLRVWETYDDIVETCCHAWNKLIAQPQRVKSIATRKWAVID